MPPAATSKQISISSESGTLSEEATKNANAAHTNGVDGSFPALSREEDELVEKEIRDRFKKMCEGYFDSVSKKLVIEHNVSVSCKLLQVVDVSHSVYKSKIERIMKHISARARSLKTVSKHMRR